MTEALRGLLDGVFDYAGLFPPARLAMHGALETYIRLIEGEEQWMVGRFVCPSDRLHELAKALDQRQSSPEILVSVIGKITTDSDEWGYALEEDARYMTAFMNAVGDAAALEAFEVRVPSHLHIESYLNDLKAFSEVNVFVELPLTEGLEASLANIAQTEWICAKARTGGLQASAFPTSEALAGFLHAAMALEVPFKLTAGLHHALPTVDEETGGRMHGFLNVLAASGLALGHDLSRNEMAEVLRDDSIHHWTFGNDKITWKGMDVTGDCVNDMRDIFLGIGSCSVDEPLADLKALGLFGGGDR